MALTSFQEFDIYKDDWRLYVERLEQYFIVNKISSELQVPTLITVMGATSYELLVNLCTPLKPKTKTLEQIKFIMEKHLQPKPSMLEERHKFLSRKQLTSENIWDYVFALKKISKTCEFGARIEESLRDQLVCGIKSETIRQRLFAEPKLDFIKAYNLAISLEAAEKDEAGVVEGSVSATSDSDGRVNCPVGFVSFQEFDIYKDNWRLYVERLEQYFIVNKISSELQVPTLITVMGATSYELLVNLCSPLKPKTKTLEQIKFIMEKHLQPQPSKLEERHKFLNRKQLTSENISDYVAALKKMSETCEFGARLEESLRDQLVYGIKSETIRHRLFAEAKLNFMKAYNLAVSCEAAEKEAAGVVEGSVSATSEAEGRVNCQLMTSTRRRKWPRGRPLDDRRARASQARRATSAAAIASVSVKRKPLVCVECVRDWNIIIPRPSSRRT